MTFNAEQYVVVSEDNKVTVHNDTDSDVDAQTEEVRIFVKQDGENTMILAKGDDYVKKVKRVSDAEAAFSFRDNIFYKLVLGNGFVGEDLGAIYCSYIDQDNYRFAKLTQSSLAVDGETYDLYTFANGGKTFCYSNEKYIDLDFIGVEEFRFNDRDYRVLRQETKIPYEDYINKDDYRLLLRGDDIVFLTYVLEDGKAYFQFDLGSGITASQSLWSFYDGNPLIFFTPTDENDLTTLKPVHISSDQVSFGNSVCFDEVYEGSLYGYFRLTEGNFVSAEFVSTNLTSTITVDKYGQFLTKYGTSNSNTDFKVYCDANFYRLFQIDGKYYRITLESNPETHKTEEIRVVVNSTSGDSIDRYCIAENASFDFYGTYRINGGDSIVLTKDGKLTYDNVEYQVVTIDGKKYARNASTFKRISKVDENEFQFVSEALYSASDLIEATVDEVLSDLEKNTNYQLIQFRDLVTWYEFSIRGDKAYYNNRLATLYKDGSGKLTAIESTEGKYPASIITNEDGEATIVIDGYEYYTAKAATIPEEYLWKRYYTFYGEDYDAYSQDTLYFARVYDGSAYVKGLFSLNANDNNIIHTRGWANDRIVEDFDYLQETSFSKESDMLVVGNVYYDSFDTRCTFEFRDDGSLVYGGKVYYEAKEAANVPAEYHGSYYDQYRRIIEIIDDEAVKTETSRVEILTSAKELSKVYYIENDRGARLYLKDFYQTTKYSQSKVDLGTHPLRQLVGSNLVKLKETTKERADRYIKPGTYYTRFYNDLYDGYDSHFYEGYGHLDYFGLTFRSFNDVTYVRNAGGYSTTIDKYGNIDSSKIYFSQDRTTAIISQNNVPNRCYYYTNEFEEFCFVYQFATEAIQICFEKELRYQPDEEKTAKFYIYERINIGDSATDNRYSLVWSNDEYLLKYVSIVEPTELPDGMLGNYVMTFSPDGVTGVYNTDLSNYHRVYRTSDGKFKFQQLRYCDIADIGVKFTFFDYDIRYDEAEGRYLYGYYRTWTENADLKIDAATDFEPVGQLVYNNGTLTVISFNARQSTMDDRSYVVTQNVSKYAKIVATDVNFATLGMVGNTYFGMNYYGLNLNSIVSVTNADTVNMFINICSLKFFNAKLIVTSAVENATENNVEYVGYLFSVDDETSVYVPIVITKYESGEIEFRFNYMENDVFLYDDFIITEVHESNLLKGVEGVVEFKSRVNGTERAETAIFDSENNTITFYVGDDYECENMQTFTVTKFFYNADESAMYCIADGRVFFFTYADGKIETTLQIQFVVSKLNGNRAEWFEFYVPEKSEGGESGSGESSGEAGGETNA